VARGPSGNDHGGLCLCVIVVVSRTARYLARTAAASSRRRPMLPPSAAEPIFDGQTPFFYKAFNNKLPVR
jgi:hypothetical protein